MATPSAVQSVNSGTYLGTLTVTTATSGTLSPAATAGSLLEWVVAVDKDSGTFTPPSGWTATIASSGASVSMAVFTKIAAGGETSASCSWGTAQKGYGSILTEYQNCTGVDVVQLPPYSDTAVTGMSVGPATPTVDGLATAVFVADSAATTSSLAPAASGWTKVFDSYDATPSSGRPPLAIDHRTAATVAGTAVPSTAFTWTNSDQVQGAMILLKGSGASPDTTAPTVPTGVTATANSSTSVTIGWTASTDAVGVASYRIRRGGVDLTGATALTGTSFTDTSVVAGTAYSYTVSAVDAAGNRSAESTAATVTTPTPDTTAPTVPTSVTAVADSSTQVTVSWTASTDAVGVASYRVRQGGVDVDGATAVTGTSFPVTGLTPSTAYSFTVSAVDAAGNRSAESTAATASTPATPVTPPAPAIPAPDPVRPPAQWSMFSRAADYSIDLPLPILSAEFVRRHMGVSTAVASTPYSAERWASLQPSRGIELWRNGRQEFTGRVTAREINWDAQTGRAVIKIEAKGDESRLAKRLSFPDPLRAADDQTVNDYWMSRVSGTATAKVASTAMLQLISDQAGATCKVDRQIPGLTLGPDPAAGLSRVWSALFPPVLEQLALMSVASGANLGLRMTSATGSLTATIVAPRDLTATVVFSADLSNLVGFTYRETEPDVTHALAAGQGDLHLRLRKFLATTDPLALAWGEQFWSYIDRRDTADVAELTKADQDAIDGGGPTVSLAVRLTDSQAATYGVDWGLGDAITVYVGLPGQTKVASVSDVCREIAFTVDDKGVELITPAIGTYDAKAVLPTPTQQKLTEVATSLSNVARK